MTETTLPRRSLPGGALSILPALAVVLVIGLVLSNMTATTRTSAQTGRWTHPDTWTNGVVSATLGTGIPGVTVAAAQPGGPYGLYAGLAGIEEIGGNNAVLSQANFTAADWTMSNSSSPAGLAMKFAASMPVVRNNGVNVTDPTSVSVLLTGVAGSSAPGSVANSVTMTISIDNWPWLHPAADALALLIPLAPNNTRSEQLADGSANTMNCVAVGNQTTREFLTWSGQASVVDASGQSSRVGTAASVGGNANASVIAIALAGGSVGYPHYQFTLQIGIIGAPAHLVVSMTYALIGIIGGLVGAAVVVIVVSRVWNQSPNLREIKG